MRGTTIYKGDVKLQYTVSININCETIAFRDKKTWTFTLLVRIVKEVQVNDIALSADASLLLPTWLKQKRQHRR